VAIVQISRIQHRRGVAENLPQLAVGEIGLAVDTKRVYIGNGGTDAPRIENIELLTASSDLLDSADTYTYKGAAAGYTATTGANAATPVTRTMQQKFDDMASVKDFGAKGDGSTDDSAAINRALFQLFCRSSADAARRSLFFPAGTYICNDTVRLPPFAKIYGEGHNSSIIKSNTLSAPNTVLQTVDSQQQLDGTIGAGGATLPGQNHIEGLTFHCSADNNDVVTVNQAQTVTFMNCKFLGFNTSAPTGVGNSQAGVKLESSTTRETEHVHFIGCVFERANFCVVADHDMSSITFSGCDFTQAFKGIKIGESRTGSAPSIDGPRGVKVTSSLFDKIYSHAIHGYFGPGLISAFNTFKDCANNNLGVGNANTHVVNFARTGMHSIGDDFERQDADETSSTLRVNHQGMSLQESQVQFNNYVREFGGSVNFTDNTSATTTGITFSDNNNLENAVEVEYLITRGTAKRQGVLTITHDATAQIIDDDFQENNGTVGVTFSLTNAANITTLNYTTTSTGSGATFKYTIRYIR